MLLEILGKLHGLTSFNPDSNTMKFGIFEINIFISEGSGTEG